MASRVLSGADIREAVRSAFQRFNPLRVILFGSHARGTADEESDVDLIVVYETEKRFLDRLRELYMAWDLPKSADILAYTPAEFEELKKTRAFIQDVVETGTVVYERD